MPILLRNQRNPKLHLILTAETWVGILDLAVAYKWNSLGTVLPGYWHSLEYSLGDYLPEQLDAQNFTTETAARLVTVDDALNLADSLEQAFLDYEPRRLRGTTLLYSIEDPAVDRRPSIGAISETSSFCRSGAFWIELYHPSDPV